MYNYFNGEIVDINNKEIVVDINGIGYRLMCSYNSLKSIVLGTKHKIYAYLNVKKDSHTLFGFTEQGERDCFEILIATSGIGPKIAIEILSTFNISQLKDCILSENVNMLTQVSGLGLKKAKKLIIESKDKIKLISGDRPTQFINNDLIDALINLGYNKKEIMNKIQQYDNLEDGIKDMLKRLT